MTYTARGLVGIAKVWNLAQNNIYVEIIFMALNDILSPVFLFWCDVDYSTFIKYFVCILHG